MIKKQNLESLLRKIKPIKKIKDYADKANKKVYLVGGMLRDLLLGFEICDIDIAISGKGQDFAKVLGRNFRLKKGLDEFRVTSEGVDIDVSGLGSTEILEDLGRRDFTINAMAYNLLDKRFIDPFNGVKDLENGIIRTMGRKNIVEDSCRILRGLRFRAYLGFEIEENTEDLFKEYAGKLAEVAPERIHFELTALFNADKAHLAVFPEIFDKIFPGFLKMKEIKGGKISENLLEHSILTLEKMENLSKDFSLFGNHKKKIEAYYSENKTALKIAALLHDIKKPDAMEVDGDEVHFYGHDKMASDWFKKIGKELKFSADERNYISKLMLHHMWIHLLAAQQEVTERAKRRLCFELESDVIGLALLSCADQTATTGVIDPHLTEVCKDIIGYYFSMKDEVEKPLLKGRDLIANFNLSPGPVFGEILSKVQMAYEEGRIKTKEEALEFVKKNIKGLDIKEV
ncbi:CCA tRNA nucleotidyltransferase [candidate division WOR-3 bacterium]|nr:CCA tRNA nucleotidyltransferase [candidate division WOR-3 bacterium]